MILDNFIEKYYSFPPIEKDQLKAFLENDEIDKWILSHILIPKNHDEEFLALVSSNNLEIFEKIETYLVCREIDLSQFSKAAKSLGTLYSSFHPSIDISKLF